MSIIITWLVNVTRAIRNGWRRLLRRRVDYVRLDATGALPEFVAPLRWWQRRFLGARQPASLQGLRRAFERVAADQRAAGVLLKIDGLSAGWATLQSLRDEIGRLRRSGKRVVAYLVTPDLRGYYAACAADEILVPPAAFLTIVGLRSEIQFLKDALAKVGLAAEVEAVSPYKSAGEQFVRSDISPENRQQLERLLDGRFAEVVRAIGAARGLDDDAVRAAIDAAPLSAPAARERGLVDGLCYEDELAAWLGLPAAERAEGMEKQIEERLPASNDSRRPLSAISAPSAAKKEAVILDWGAARKVLRLPPARRPRGLVAVVPVEGAIVAGHSRSLPLPIPLLGGAQAGAASVAQALRQVERNRRVAAVVLYVNSPGGDAFASDLIWREVLRVRRQKPVVVAMGDVAASGGYYVAAPASAIVAQPGTLTGSIGVVSLRPIASGLLERAGVNTVVISRGARSGLLSIVEPPSEDERQAWRDLIFTSYHDFQRRVREGRDMTEQQLDPIAGGRVWMGAEALGLGLVDQLGGLPEAVLRAQELADLPRDRSAPLLLARGGRAELPPRPFPASSLLDLWPLLEEALRPRILALMPFDGI